MAKGWRLQPSETQRKLRGLVLVTKQDRKPAAADRIGLWLSTSRQVDGLWVGTMESKPHPALHRTLEALRLIERHDPLHYARVTGNLERVWVHLVPNALAHYEASINACLLDERFVLHAETTLEEIASTIVHEATHARLDRWGIRYDEDCRTRIEAVCIRRELNFIAKLPHTEPLQDVKADILEWCASDHDYYTDENFQQRIDAGNVEALRYLGTSEWIIRCVLKGRGIVSGVRQQIERLTARSRRQA